MLGSYGISYLDHSVKNIKCGKVWATLGNSLSWKEHTRREPKLHSFYFRVKFRPKSSKYWPFGNGQVCRNPINRKSSGALQNFFMNLKFEFFCFFICSRFYLDVFGYLGRYVPVEEQKYIFRPNWRLLHLKNNGLLYFLESSGIFLNFSRPWCSTFLIFLLVRYFLSKFLDLLPKLKTHFWLDIMFINIQIIDPLRGDVFVENLSSGSGFQPSQASL